MSILPSSCSSVDNSCLSACNTCFNNNCSLSSTSSCSFSCASPSNCNPLAINLIEKCQSDFQTLLCQVACSKCSTSQLNNEIARPQLETCNSSTRVAICSSKFANSTYDLAWSSLNPGNVTIKYANGSVALANTNPTSSTTSLVGISATATTTTVAQNSEINLKYHSGLHLIFMAALFY